MTLTRVYRYELLQEASLQGLSMSRGMQGQGLIGPDIVHHGEVHLGTVPQAPHDPHRCVSMLIWLLTDDSVSGWSSAGNENVTATKGHSAPERCLQTLFTTEQ